MHEQRPRARRIAITAIVGAIVGAALLGAPVAGGAAPADASPRITVTASSTAKGTSAVRLLTASTATRAVTWRSAGTAKGSSVVVRWSAPSWVSAVTLRGTATKSLHARAATITFSDGAPVSVQANAKGDVTARFSARSVQWLKVTVTDAASKAAVALSTVRVQSAPAGDVASSATASASSNAGGSRSAALNDGTAPSRGNTGASWSAAAGGEQWAQLTWSGTRRLQTVQLFGSASTTGAITSGTLSFSDGSSIVVGRVQAAVVSGGQTSPSPPTTVAFTPRSVSWVRFTATAQSAAPSLREFAAYEAGVTAPLYTGATSSTLGTVTAATAQCSTTDPTTSSTKLLLLCPTPGTALAAGSTVQIAAPSGATVSATAWVPTAAGSASGSLSTVSTATASASGVATFVFNATVLGRLTNGPMAIRFTTPSRTSVTVDFVNRLGKTTTAASSAAVRSGLSLVYDEEFTRSLPVSWTGVGAEYAATQSNSWYGRSDFGEAIFADPAGDTANLRIVNGGYLRLRTSPAAADGSDDWTGWGRTENGAILSSGSAAGAGFQAQYGYFEARMLAPAEAGTWPAFWTLSNGSLRKWGLPTSEADATELYGTDSTSSCASVHDWSGAAAGTVTDAQSNATQCALLRSSADTSLSWHTYGVKITRTGTTFTIDGAVVRTTGALAQADQPFFFLLDLALGPKDSNAIDLSATGGITDLYVDWVRVYT